MTMRNVILSFYNNIYIYIYCSHLNQFYVDEMALHNFIFAYAMLYYYTYTKVNTDPNWYINNHLHKEVLSIPYT